MMFLLLNILLLFQLKNTLGGVGPSSSASSDAVNGDKFKTSHYLENIYLSMTVNEQVLLKRLLMEDPGLSVGIDNHHTTNIQTQREERQIWHFFTRRGEEKKWTEDTEDEDGAVTRLSIDIPLLNRLGFPKTYVEFGSKGLRLTSVPSTQANENTRYPPNANPSSSSEVNEDQIENELNDSASIEDDGESNENNRKSEEIDSDSIEDDNSKENSEESQETSNEKLKTKKKLRRWKRKKIRNVDKNDKQQQNTESTSQRIVDREDESEEEDKFNKYETTHSDAPKCTTGKGGRGRCLSVKECPLILTDLALLRKSVCFKGFFVPGVCCPENGIKLEILDENLELVNKIVVDENHLHSSENELSEGSYQQNTIHNFPPQIHSFKPPPPVFLVPPATITRPEPGSTNFIKLQQERPSNFNRPVIFRPRPTSSHENRPRVESHHVPGTSIVCGRNDLPQGRIIGGESTYEGQFPWMAAIYLLRSDRGREFWCGGSLVSREHIITAAHCTKDNVGHGFQATQFSVVLGDWDRSSVNSNSREYRVIKYEIHQQFRRNGFYNDIAIFKLDKPVEFTRYIQPICLPFSKDDLNNKFVNSLPIALGWGVSNYTNTQEENILRQLVVPVWTNQRCDDVYLQPIEDIFLCAGYDDGSRDACQGDSGGPLMLYNPRFGDWTLIGIVSFGNKCATPKYPGVYTRITEFHSFILQNLN